MNDRSLRNIVLGLGGTANGVPREARLRHHRGLRGHGDPLPRARPRRPARRALDAHRRGLRRTDGKPVDRRRAEGAPAPWPSLLQDAIMPNLVQTLRGHAGVRARRAVRQHRPRLQQRDRHPTGACSSATIVVTEAGFGFDLGAEKFFDIKCRAGGLKPAAAVVVATVRALKLHGGVALDDLAKRTSAARRDAALENLAKHVENVAHVRDSPRWWRSITSPATPPPRWRLCSTSAAAGACRPPSRAAGSWAGRGRRSWPRPCCARWAAVPRRRRASSIPMSGRWCVRSRPSPPSSTAPRVCG